MEGGRYSRRRIQVYDRAFTLQILPLVNGCFLSVSEGDEARMGSLAVAFKAGGRATSRVVIPGRLGGALLTMLGELVAYTLGGVAVVSLHLLGELTSDSMKQLLAEVKDLLQEASQQP